VERIDGRCSELEQRVIDVEQRLEVSSWRSGASTASSSASPWRISTPSWASSAPVPPLSSTFVDGPDGHRVANHHRDREPRSVDTHPHIPVNGMNQIASRVPEHSHELGHFVDYMRAVTPRVTENTIKSLTLQLSQRPEQVNCQCKSISSSAIVDH
jgi:hypothetical protein